MRTEECQTHNDNPILRRVSDSLLSNPSYSDSCSQQFWGNMVHTAGAGPAPVPHKLLDTQKLTEGLSYCLTKEAAVAANEIALQMSIEDGVKTAVRSFHANLPRKNMQCELLPDQPAAWRYKHGSENIKLSKLAVEILLKNQKIQQDKLKL